LTQPFGFWGPVKARFKSTFTNQIRSDAFWDLITLTAALPWQFLLYLIWMGIVMQAWITFGVSAGVVVILSVVLYFTWLRRLNQQSLHKRVIECVNEDDIRIITGVPTELREVKDEHTEKDDSSVDHNNDDIELKESINAGEGETL
jgi:uncharacterized membrane protein